MQIRVCSKERNQDNEWNSFFPASVASRDRNCNILSPTPARFISNLFVSRFISPSRLFLYRSKSFLQPPCSNFSFLLNIIENIIFDNWKIISLIIVKNYFLIIDLSRETMSFDFSWKFVAFLLLTSESETLWCFDFKKFFLNLAIKLLHRYTQIKSSESSKNFSVKLLIFD